MTTFKGGDWATISFTGRIASEWVPYHSDSVTVTDADGRSLYVETGGVKVQDLMTPGVEPEPKWNPGDVIITNWSPPGLLPPRAHPHTLLRVRDVWVCTCSTGAREGADHVTANWKRGNLKIIIKDGKVLT